MERAQLEGLRHADLQYFTKVKAITSPAGVSHKHLVDLILEYQAKVLSERAKKALEQVRGSVDGLNETDFVVVDGLNQSRHSSVDLVEKPSESSQTGQTGVNSTASGSSQTGLERVEERDEMNPESKRMKEASNNSSVVLDFNACRFCTHTHTHRDIVCCIY